MIFLIDKTYPQVYPPTRFLTHYIHLILSAIRINTIRTVFFCFSFSLLFSVKCRAGGENPPAGARSLGLANASVTLLDEWGFFNNISTISHLNRFSAFASFQNLYGIPSLNRIVFGLVAPIHKIVAGTGFYRYGDAYYSETTWGTGVAHSIQQVSLGVKISYHQISISEGGIKRNLIIEFGGSAKISEKVRFGAHIYNLNQAKVNKDANEWIPVILKAGLSYTPFEKLLIAVESEKQLDFNVLVKAGIEYSIIRKLKIRAGCSIYPNSFYAGLGFHDSNKGIDYAITSHPVLGISQQLSLTYSFQRQ